MNQFETGIRIKEIRNRKGLTQQDLSEACTVDIRTIQRIETGDVTPRHSTIKIIAAALECNPSDLTGEFQNVDPPYIKQFLLVSAISGVIYFISLLLYIPIIPKLNLHPGTWLYLAVSVIYLLGGVFFYYGFYQLGKHRKSKGLQIASFFILITMPIFVITGIASGTMGDQIFEHITKLIVILMSLNGILFGIGLLNAKSSFPGLYKTGGIFQILTASMFMLPVPLVQLTGLWLSIPYILILISIVISEYRNKN